MTPNNSSGGTRATGALASLAGRASSCGDQPGAATSTQRFRDCVSLGLSSAHNQVMLVRSSVRESAPRPAVRALWRQPGYGTNAFGNALGSSIADSMRGDDYSRWGADDTETQRLLARYPAPPSDGGAEPSRDWLAGMRMLLGDPSSGLLTDGEIDSESVEGLRLAFPPRMLASSGEVFSDAGPFLGEGALLFDDESEAQQASRTIPLEWTKAMQGARIPIGPRILLDDFGNPVGQQVTLQQLQAIMPNAGPQAETYLQPLISAMNRSGIDTPERQAAFLAQLAHESGELRSVEENLTYSARRLTEVWPKRFPSLEAAEPYANSPEALGNYVYANRLGNGDAASGDGFRFRGAGLIQLTGRANYTEFGFEQNPELLRQPEFAASAAAEFWDRRGLNRTTNQELTRHQFDEVSRVVNGGDHGAYDRWRYYQRALEVIVRTQWRP